MILVLVVGRRDKQSLEVTDVPVQRQLSSETCRRGPALWMGPVSAARIAGNLKGGGGEGS